MINYELVIALVIASVIGAVIWEILTRLYWYIIEWICED